MNTLGFDICGYTGAGCVRPSNEDHILVGRFIKNEGTLSLAIAADDDYVASYGLVLAVADGIGGSAGGATASRLTLESLDAQFYNVEKGENAAQAAREALESAGRRANESVLAVAAKEPAIGDMGCTLTGVCLLGSSYLVFNSGDSRVYRFRNGRLQQLTRDESIAEDAIEAGVLTRDEADDTPANHQLTNLVGSNHFRLTITEGPDLKPDNALLVCSDGIHDMIDIDTLEQLLNENRSATDTVADLVETASRNGGRDNISVIVARHVAEKLPASRVANAPEIALSEGNPPEIPSREPGGEVEQP